MEDELSFSSIAEVYIGDNSAPGELCVHVLDLCAILAQGTKEVLSAPVWREISLSQFPRETSIRKKRGGQGTIK